MATGDNYLDGYVVAGPRHPHADRARQGRHRLAERRTRLRERLRRAAVAARRQLTRLVPDRHEAAAPAPRPGYDLISTRPTHLNPAAVIWLTYRFGTGGASYTFAGRPTPLLGHQVEDRANEQHDLGQER